MNREEEIMRLLAPSPDGEPSSAKIIETFNVHCAGDANLVLSRAKEVLLTIIKVDPNDWPSEIEWQQRLPAWFVGRSAAEDFSQTDPEVRKLTSSFTKRSPIDEVWSVGAFIFWFMPDERGWFWWSSNVENSNLFQVKVVAIDLPFPWESLAWLLRASGALRVEEA